MSTRGPSIAPRASLAPLPQGAASSPESSSPGGPVTSIVTLREWVLPPRPKPGRKPSVDTPASKRKAQNRAAQRAFRERRATRVQELEEKLLEVEKEKEIKEMGLVNTINKLKFENQFLTKSLDQLRNDFNSFRNSMTNGASPRPETTASTSTVSLQYTSETSNPYKSELSQSAQHLLNLAKSLPTNHSTGSPALLQYSVQQILPAPSADSPPALLIFHRVLSQSRLSQITPLSQDRSPEKRLANTATDDFDCGVCIEEQCLCEDVGLKSSKTLEETINTFTPMAAVSLRGKRKSAVSEIDFTSEYSFKKMPDLKRLRKHSLERTVKKEPATSKSVFNEDSPVENCGFCSDDTPCVCREAAKEAARLNDSLTPRVETEQDEAGSTLLPPIQTSTAVRKSSLPVMHPGPSLEIREFANMATVPTVVTQGGEENSTTSSQEEEKSGCTGNPGTCNQCQMDPVSTLFCTTVASKAAREKEAKVVTKLEIVPEEEIKVETPGGDVQSATPSEALSRPSLAKPSSELISTSGANGSEIFIPCADAYKTLSRHKRFNLVDFSSLVGRLTTRGMLVEVQSVANVIRELDRKVYD